MYIIFFFFFLISLKFYFFGALKEADVFRYPIDKKAFETGKDWLEKLIYENNPKNIIDYRKIMTFEVFNRTDIVFVKAAEIKEGNEISYTLCDLIPILNMVLYSLS